MMVWTLDEHRHLIRRGPLEFLDLKLTIIEISVKQRVQEAHRQDRNCPHSSQGYSKKACHSWHPAALIACPTRMPAWSSGVSSSVAKVPLKFGLPPKV